MWLSQLWTSFGQVLVIWGNAPKPIRNETKTHLTTPEATLKPLLNQTKHAHALLWWFRVATHSQMSLPVRLTVGEYYSLPLETIKQGVFRFPDSDVPSFFQKFAGSVVWRSPVGVQTPVSLREVLKRIM